MASTITVGVLRALLTLDTATFESGMRDASGSAKKFASEMQKIGSGLTSIGTQLTAAVTVPIVAAFAGASKAAIDFESSFAGVRKTVDASEGEFKALEQQFRGLAKTIPVNVNELNRLGEAAGALGIPKDKIAEFTRVMAELGVTTNVTSEQAANDIAKIQNIFGASGQATENFASTLVDLGNKGASTEQEILALATRIASAGNTVGLTQDQVLGFAAAIANVGMEAEAGGSAMSRVFNEISKAVSAGGKDLNNFAQVAQMSASAFAQMFRQDAAAATQKFIEGLGQIKQGGGDLNATLTALGFTELRQSDLLRRLAGDSEGVGKALGTANAAWKANTALSTEAGTRFETTASQLTLLWNRLTDVAITFGNAFLPAIKTAIRIFDGLMPLLEGASNAFAALPGPVQAVILGVAGLAALAGPVLLFFGQLAFAASSLAGIGGFGGLMASIGKLVGLSGFGGLSGAITGVTKVLGAFLTWPWGALLAAAVLLAPILWEMVGGWDGIKQALAGVVDRLTPVVQFIGDLATIAWHVAKVVLSALGDAFMGLVGMLKTVFTAINDWVIQPLQKLEDMVFDATGINWLFDQIKVGAHRASEAVEELALDIKNAADVAKQVDKAQADLKNTGFNKQVAGNALKVPGMADLEQYEAALNRVPAPLKKIVGLTAEADEKTKKAKWGAEDWALSVDKVREKMKALAFEGFKDIIADERKAAEQTADAWLKAFNIRTQAEQELTRVTRDQGLQRMQAEIDYAKDHGATWQQVYELERRLSAAKLQAAIDDAEHEFQIRTAGMDRTTKEGEAAYQALKAVHDATVAGMVETHARGEATKREELARTHNVWIRSLDAIKALVASLSQTISEHLTDALLRATSFKDAFVGIWQSIKQSLLSIFGDILNSFIKTVLDGAIGALMGRRGAFSQAFSGLFGGGGGLGGLLGNSGGGLLGGLLGGGASNASVAAVLAGNAGIASATTAGMAATGAGAGGAAAGAGAGGGGLGSLGAFMTNPWTIGVAAAVLGGLAIWKSGAFRGGEEGVKVNPARDAFFGDFQRVYGGTQFEALAKAFAEKGISGDIAERLIKQLYDADTMKKFEVATKAITDALNAAENKLQATQHAITQLSTTAETLGSQGKVSSDVMAALQTAIRGLSTTGSVEQIRLFNTQLLQLLQSGTATNESVAALTAQIVALGDQAAQVDTPDLEASAQAVDRVNDALTQFNATIDHLQSMGTVGEEAINALRAQIADLSATTDPEVIQRLNDTLTRMIEEGTATDETVQVLADTIEKMSQQNTQTTSTTDDLTGASLDLEKQFDRNCWISNEMRRRLAELEAQTGSTQEAWRRLMEELSRPIDVQVNVPSINLDDYISGGGGGDGGFTDGMVPSFATEGIARAPMLAMVGDAGPGNPEWILHQSTLGAALRQMFSFGTVLGAMQTQTVAAAHLRVDGQGAAAAPGATGETFVNNGAITVIAPNPQSFVQQFKQMMRHDHSSVVALRKAVV